MRILKRLLKPTRQWVSVVLLLPAAVAVPVVLAVGAAVYILSLGHLLLFPVADIIIRYIDRGFSQ